MSGTIAKRIDGRHVLAGLLAFFAVVAFANAIFVYSALTTFGGIDTEDAYRRGLAYNATLTEADQQSALGWRTSLTHDRANGALRLTIEDRESRPITGLSISGRLSRPATSRQDLNLAHFEEHAGGVYEIALGAMPSGNWIADLVVQSVGNAPYRMRERLWLP